MVFLPNYTLLTQLFPGLQLEMFDAIFTPAMLSWLYLNTQEAEVGGWWIQDQSELDSMSCLSYTHKHILYILYTYIWAEDAPLW